MKFNIRTTAALITGVLALGAISCKKFIKEELVTTLNEDYYKTDAGLEDLVKSAYAPLQWKFTGEQAYAMFNFGLDEFRLGDQTNNGQFNLYNSTLNSSDLLVNDMWINNYAGIRRCNQGIDLIPQYSNAASKVLATQAQKDQRVGELKALRALYYLMMVQQLGGVPLVTSVPANPQFEFPRASVAEVYRQIIRDLREAGPALPWRYTSTDRGRATRAMAWHFLAKAYLTRASAVTEQRGQQTTDLDSVVYYANDLISNSGHALEADYGSLFNASYPDGRIAPLGEVGAAPTGSKARIDANNASNEIIFAAQFSSNLALAGLNNTTHLYYPTQYDAGMPGMVRDFYNGRPFRRLRPTDYTIDIFDKINDSRFFKTFQTVYYRNVAVTATETFPKFTAANAPNATLVGKPRVMPGDTASLFIVNPDTLPLLATTIAAMRYYAVFVRNRRAVAGGAVTSDYSANKYLTMWKLADPIRIGNTPNETRGIRNGTLARLDETILILAEAYGRKGDYANALVQVNKLRTRAAYKTNEERSAQIWQYMGGPNTLASTENNNQATMALFATNVASEQYPASATSIASRFINFMLNERTRELCGEFYRWEDLARTETFYERTRQFNPDITASFAPYHKLRPIPLLQMISQTTNGQPMSAANMSAYQNPGYY